LRDETPGRYGEIGFREIGTNSLLEFEEGELNWLAEIGSELKSLITSSTRARQLPGAQKASQLNF
jgi:hypothetical protein